MSLRRQIVDSVVAAVRQVTVANGYDTDAGRSVKVAFDGVIERVGTAELGVTVTPTQATRSEQGSGKVLSQLEVTLYGWTAFPRRDGVKDQYEVWQRLDDLAGDLERAVTLDHTRSGLAHDTLPTTTAYVVDPDNDAIAWVAVTLSILHEHQFTDPRSVA